MSAPTSIAEWEAWYDKCFPDSYYTNPPPIPDGKIPIWASWECNNSLVMALPKSATNPDYLGENFDWFDTMNWTSPLSRDSSADPKDYDYYLSGRKVDYTIFQAVMEKQSEQRDRLVAAGLITAVASALTA